MQTVSAGELKAEFSTILNQVKTKKEKFIIKFGKKHEKVAMLVPYEKERKKERKFGIYEGKYQIPNDFNKEDKEINDMFYDSKINP